MGPRAVRCRRRRGDRASDLWQQSQCSSKVLVLLSPHADLSEADDRAKERHYRAWDLINSAWGRPATAGELRRFRTSTRTALASPGLLWKGLTCSKLT
jgi:hypothetical protein